ncbi:MAG: hypothetical protein JSS53_04910, partial [Proteobacteria bacterium]|nr:hypothetical protein [Pseudomonadota bacterium]
ITSYITNKDLAVTIEKNKFIIYGPDAPIVLKIPNTLENLDAFTKNLRDFFIKKRSSDYAKLEFDLTKTLIKEQLTNSDNRAGKPANFFQPATTQLLAVSPSKKSRPRSTQYIRPQNF